MLILCARVHRLIWLLWSLLRYKEVIEVCQLQPDIDTLPQGDQTVIGERVRHVSYHYYSTNWAERMFCVSVSVSVIAVSLCCRASFCPAASGSGSVWLELFISRLMWFSWWVQISVELHHPHVRITRAPSFVLSGRPVFSSGHSPQRSPHEWRNPQVPPAGEEDRRVGHSQTAVFTSCRLGTSF